MTIRSSYTLWISELLSSIILLIVILRTFELNDHQTGMFIGSIVMIGYWITPSTFFVNPALTFARTLTNTFVGIRLIDAFIFILFQYYFDEYNNTQNKTKSQYPGNLPATGAQFPVKIRHPKYQR